MILYVISERKSYLPDKDLLLRFSNIHINNDSDLKVDLIDESGILKINIYDPWERDKKEKDNRIAEGQVLPKTGDK